MGRLLYEVDSTPNSAKKLWQLLPMNKIRNNFFAGNDLMGEDRRLPQTLKSYVVSYQMFLKFVLSSEKSIRVLEEIGDDDPYPPKEKTPAAPAPGPGKVNPFQNLGKIGFAQKCLLGHNRENS